MPHLLALGVGVYLLFGFGFGLKASPVQWAALVLFWLACLLLAEPRLWRGLRPLYPPSSQITALLAAILFGTAAASLLMIDHLPVGPFFIVPSLLCLGLFFRRLLTQALRSDRTDSPEIQRLAWLLLIAGFLMHPYATTRLVGGGDAEHYVRQLADFLTQVRDGQFPVFVGQSPLALDGAVHPLRTAPYFQYAGGLLAVLTGFTLAPAALQNLLLVTSFLAAIVGCYAALCLAVPARRWECLWLALLYGTSPAILTLAYGGDMFATWMTLPWLPWLFLGVIVSWRKGVDGKGLVLQAVTLAFLWLAHAPVALWASLVVLASELTRLASARFTPALILRQAGAASLCLLLCSYVFFSVSSLDVPANPYLEFELARGVVFRVLTENWHGWFRLVSPEGNNLMSDLHLSPGLLLLAVAGVATAWRTRGAAPVLAVVAFALGMLLMPSAVTERFWTTLPAFLMTVTEKWPAQRLYPLLSALLPFLGALALTHPRLGTPRIRRGVLMVLAACVVWSGWEARKFVHHGQAIVRSADATTRFFLPENNTVSRYSYEMWGYLPKTFSFGHMDLEAHHRLIDPLYGQVLDSNALAIYRAGATGPVHRFVPTSEGGYFSPTITLEPGESCFLSFDFQGWEPSGTLLVEGRRLARQYSLPASGGVGAFGIRPGHKPGFTLRNLGTEAEQVDLRFVQDRHSGSAARATITVLPYDGSVLPFRLHSLQPYELDVTTPAGGWVETPRVLIPGYRVTIDGQPAEVRRSPNGLLMTKVGPGTHRLNIAYTAPPSVAVSFWVSLLAIAVVGTLLVTAQVARSERRSDARRLLEQWLLPRLGWGGLAVASLTGSLLLIGLPNRGPRTVVNSDGALQSFAVMLPVGRHEVYETLLSWTDEHGASTSIVLFYEDDGHARIGCRKNGVLKLLTESLPVSYFVAQQIDIMIGALLTEADRGKHPDLDDEAWQRLRGITRVYFNHEPVWETDTRHQIPENLRFAIGKEIVPVATGETPFHGRTLSQPAL